MLTITIDWLAGTFRSFTNEAEEFIRTYASFPDVQDIKPRNGYRVAQMDGNGAQLLWNPNDNRMGHHVVFSGSALRSLFEQMAIQPTALLRACLDAGLRISRLDLAKDLTGQALDGEAIYKRLASGIGGGTTQKFSRIENAQGGQTIYMGSRQSERFVRLYDKAQESGDNSKPWWRLEIETKGDVARIVADALTADAEPAAIFDTTIAKMVGALSNVGLEPFYSRGLVPWGIPKIEKQTDREKWIDDQVIAAVAEHYTQHRESKAIERLIAVLVYIRDNQI